MRWSSLALAALVASAGFVARADASVTTQRISQPSSGQSDRPSGAPAMTPDGRWVAFASDATTLVTGDTDGASDIFVADRRAGTVQRVSVSSSGAQAQYPPTGVPATEPAGSTSPSISDDGRFVAFASEATNFAAVATGAVNIFVRDRQAGTTTLVSVPTNGPASSGCGADDPAISGNGRYVAFTSTCSTLVAGDTNGAQDVFVRDIVNGMTERVSVNSSEAQANDASTFPAISDDGNIVAFVSKATNLWPNDTNGRTDVFTRDRAAGTTMLVSYTSTNHLDAGSLQAYPAAVSSSGRYVAFESDASDLVPGDTNASPDVFLRDRSTGALERLSIADTGKQIAAGTSDGISISDDGNRVSFSSLSPDVVTGDTNGAQDVFVRDRPTGVTERVSVTASGGEANGASSEPALTGDGSASRPYAVAFVSAATNLAGPDTNNATDVFVRGMPVPPLPAKPVITAPLPGSTLHDTAITVTGTADPTTTVRVVEGATTIGQAVVAANRSWSVAVSLPAGTHTVSAFAADPTAESLPSGSVSFTIDTSAVVPVITKPAQGASLGSQAVTVSGTAAPAAAVTLTEDTTSLATTTASASGAWSVALNLPEGPHAISASAVDGQQRTTTTTTPRSFTVDITAPVAPVITAPDEGSTIMTPSFTVAGTAEASALVTILDNGVSLTATRAASSGAWSVSFALANGDHKLSAKASDAAGNTGPASAARSITVSVDREAPSATSTTASNTVFPPDQVSIAGHATDNRGVQSVTLSYTDIVTGVTVIVDRPAACACGGASVDWSDSPALNPGYYKVVVVAHDGLNTSRPLAITFFAL